MELTGAGFTAAKRLGEGKSEVLRSFDPTAEETLFIPRLQGGYDAVAAGSSGSRGPRTWFEDV